MKLMPENDTDARLLASLRELAPTSSDSYLGYYACKFLERALICRYEGRSTVTIDNAGRVSEDFNNFPVLEEAAAMGPPKQKQLGGPGEPLDLEILASLERPAEIRWVKDVKRGEATKALQELVANELRKHPPGSWYKIGRSKNGGQNTVGIYILIPKTL